jgi:hypothetical protein
MTMDTWAKIARHMKGRHQAEVRGDKIAVEIGGTLIQLRRATISGAERVFFGVAIAPQAVVAARAALALNHKLRVGGLVFHGGKLVFRHTLLLGRFDAKELDRLIVFMAKLPAKLGPEVRRPVS